MRVELIGTAGPAGWPEPGCRCASCRRAAAAAGGRRPACVLVDGVLRLDGGEPPLPRPGYRVTDIPGGLEVTGPSGRLLCSAGPGRVPVPAPDAGRYDIVLLDLLADPAQLGLLRRRGLVTAGTVVAALHADHRVSSPAELARRCALWGVVPAADGEVLTAPDRDAADRGAPVPEVYRTLVLGGARSGKSGEAELRLAAEPQVRYVATGRRAGGDAAWAARVAAHRARRPSWWQTVETTDVAAELGRAGGAVLVDGIGGWLAAAMDDCGCWPGGPGGTGVSDAAGRAGPGGAGSGGAEGSWSGGGGASGRSGSGGADGELQRRIDELVEAWRDCAARVVAVSDETGLGVVPATSAGQLFRDQLGTLNQRLAAESDESVFVLAGQVISLSG